MKIALLGFGIQGHSSLEYWSSPGNEVTICDQNPDLKVPENTKARLGEKYLEQLDDFDLLVRSPNVHPRDIVEANSEKILEKVTSNTEEFLQVCSTKNIIGITGTKGKGTTSTLVAKMLEASGKKVHLGGNIGTPPLDLLKNGIQVDDWVVLELANFQLIDLMSSPHIAACLMVVPEHLDWHKDMDEYISAKQQLFVHQTDSDIAVYYAQNETSEKIVSVSQGNKVPYMKQPGAEVENEAIVIGGHKICKTSDIKLLGKHNWQNICAAVTVVWQVTQDVEAIRSVITSFSGLEYRLELVRELDGVTYYNDSFGTTPETAQVAIEAFEQPKVVILGGSSKGAGFAGLAETVKSGNVRHVLLIGTEAPKIRAALESARFSEFSNGGTNMQQIVAKACDISQSGDIVLLSTACASFDMFKNYKDRGEQFTRAVQALS